jgi:hypothetical protein
MDYQNIKRIGGHQKLLRFLSSIHLALRRQVISHRVQPTRIVRTVACDEKTADDLTYSVLGTMHFRMPGLGIHRLDLLRQPHHCLGRIGSEHYMMFPKSMAELSDQ